MIKWFLAAMMLVSTVAMADPVKRFDICSFCCQCDNDVFCQSHFDVLNTTSSHYFPMGTDEHRPEVEKNGSQIAAFHRDITTGWTKRTGKEGADILHKYVRAHYSSSGKLPNWLILNEISAGTWPRQDTTGTLYRKYLIELAQGLKGYGYNVVFLAPFGNPKQNDKDWQLLSKEAYIGVQKYLSGAAIKERAFSQSWCYSEYKASKDSYMARGVPEDRIFLVENFSQSEEGSAWGRSGVPKEDWTKAIAVRSVAAHAVNFSGFLSYAWSKNPMNATQEEMLGFERVYSSQVLP
jgi:hypothetical protein